jgi:O-antigen/teichoic acid export membrane protein
MKFPLKIKDVDFRELLKEGGISLFFKGFAVLASIIFTKLMNRWYGVDAYGFFMTFWSILMVVSVIAKLGFDSSIVRFIAGYKAKGEFENIKKVYRFSYFTVFFVSAFLSLAIFLFSTQLSNVFFDKDYSFCFILVGVLIIPFALMNLNAEAAKGLKNITAFSFFQNGTIYLLTTIIILVFKYFTLSTYIDVVYSFILAILILYPISQVVIYKNFKNKLRSSKPRVKLSRISKKKILLITIPMVLTNSLFMIMSWTDTIMLSAFSTNTSVGIYNTTLKIAAFGSVFLVAFNNIAMPKYAELYEDKNKSLLKFFVKRTTTVIFLASLPFFILIYLTPSFLLGLMDLNKEEVWSGIFPLLILNTGFLVSVISGTTIQLLNMVGQQMTALYILLFGTVLNIVLNYLLIPLYDINGAAAATTLTTILWNVTAVVFVFKRLGFSTYPRFRLN